jgi:hypothetical protein
MPRPKRKSRFTTESLERGAFWTAIVGFPLLVLSTVVPFMGRYQIRRDLEKYLAASAGAVSGPEQLDGVKRKAENDRSENRPRPVVSTRDPSDKNGRIIRPRARQLVRRVVVIE